MIAAIPYLLFIHILAAVIVIGANLVSLLSYYFIFKDTRPSKMLSFLAYGPIIGPSSFIASLLLALTGLAMIEIIGYPINSTWIIASLSLWVIANLIGWFFIKKSYELIGMDAGIKNGHAETRNKPIEIPFKRKLLVAEALVLLINLTGLYLMVFKPS